MGNFTGIDLTGAILQDRWGVTKYKTADEPLASSATFQNDDQLSGFTVVANAVYALELVSVFTAHASGGLKQRFVIPSGASLEGWMFGNDPGTADVQAGTPGDGQVTGIAGVTSTRLPWFIRGTLMMSSTAGVLDWQWAQNASFATATIVHKGSRLTLKRID
ncbi:hypothetical protein Lesp02_83950 [Lentzea sp. NBRC 105346]|uniref:hypothetical protein n=1 Tax=Lentzea sp. NBRC 105346 TaxID=3032205 RepID=UPI0024A32429|nr:hypothetical protein [Lentzea sp. NBRC 105346]GLZ36208.1 hypothetical protein Lesp02_83950 [Lentzea sp. NBRC 105346]